jgi:hypothetical protein
VFAVLLEESVLAGIGPDDEIGSLSKLQRKSSVRTSFFWSVTVVDVAADAASTQAPPPLPSHSEDAATLSKQSKPISSCAHRTARWHIEPRGNACYSVHGKEAIRTSGNCLTARMQVRRRQSRLWRAPVCPK